MVAVLSRMKRSSPGTKKQKIEQLFEILIRRYEREIYSYLRRYIGQAELAEDAFRVFFLQVHHQVLSENLIRDDGFGLGFTQSPPTRRSMLSVATNATEWSASTTQVVVTKTIGWGLGPEKLSGTALTISSRIALQENRDWVNSAVNSLGSPCSRYCTWSISKGLKYREAAEVLNIPVGTVKVVTCRRARLGMG